MVPALSLRALSRDGRPRFRQALNRWAPRCIVNDMARMKGQPSPKTMQFVMRLSRADKAMLVALAEKRGQTGAEILRSLLRAEHDRTFKTKGTRDAA